jgi:hypothetical protein
VAAPGEAAVAPAPVVSGAYERFQDGISDDERQSVVGLCTLNSFDPYPITYSLSNP